MSKTLNSQDAKSSIIDDLRSEGFDGVGVMPAVATDRNADRLAQYIADGHHGTMKWMPETQERRGDPKSLWSDVETIIMVAMNYGPDESYDPLHAIDMKERATISCYAHHRDYHDVMKGKLKQAAGRFVARTNAQVKVFVDTAPVMEKPLAQLAGLGWQGKHTNLLSRDLGSWFFLGSIFTNMKLPADEPETDHCGSCQSCLDVCPTNAFPAPYRLDARRCISYLTIEHAGPIDFEFRKAMGNRIYGCDDCLAVCPWNKFAQSASEAKLIARGEMQSPHLADLLKFDDKAFREYFSGSPVKRIGRNRFIRNCLIAAGNSEDRTLVEDVRPHLSDIDPIVRGSAIWSLSQLIKQTDLHVVSENYRPREQDETVRAEWAKALGEKND